jgi:CHAD domain-containing protein
VERSDPVAGNGLARAAVLGAAVAVAAVRRVLDEMAARERKRRRAFRLTAEERPADGVRRVARGQLAGAIEGLGDAAGDDPSEAVHEARKGFKRLRAVVRLARDDLGDDVYRRENGAFRDVGRRLSGVRDAKVMVETLDALTERYADELPADAFAGLRAALVREEEAAHEELRRDAATLRDVQAELADARARVAAWPLTDDAGHAVLAPGFRRIYRRGRKAYRAAAADTNAESLHDLRKRVKDLRYAGQVVGPVAPKAIRKLAKRANTLSDVIGDDHDLAVLREAAAERAATLKADELDRLRVLVDRRRARLQRKALKGAKKLYAAKPRSVAAQVERAPA